jgi:hypothetical protein
MDLIARRYTQRVWHASTCFQHAQFSSLFANRIPGCRTALQGKQAFHHRPHYLLVCVQTPNTGTELYLTMSIVSPEQSRDRKDLCRGRSVVKVDLVTGDRAIGNTALDVSVQLCRDVSRHRNRYSFLIIWRLLHTYPTRPSHSPDHLQ